MIGQSARVSSQNTYGAIDAKIGLCVEQSLPPARWLIHGAVSPEGKARTIEAMKAGRARWLARLKSEGKPIPFGRKKGGHNRPREKREHDAYFRQCRRDSRRMANQMRADRKARRARQRQERDDARHKMEEHARRKARADAGLPLWTEEEVESLSRRSMCQSSFNSSYGQF